MMPMCSTIVVVVIIIVSIVNVGGDINGDSEYAEYDDIMAGQDWGDGYYYDRNDHAVKKTLW